MKNVYVRALVALVLLVTIACASTPKIPESAHAACSLYQSNRETVIKLRAYAADHFNEFPSEVQDALRLVDGVLPELDQLGKVVCGIEPLTGDIATTATARKQIDWNAVLSGLGKLVVFAGELKKQGVL